MSEDPSKFGQTVGLFLSTVLITITYDFFKQKIGLGKNFITIVFVFIFFLIIIKATELLIILTIEKSVWIKKKLLGNKYIEGFWIDVISIEKSNEDFADSLFAYIQIKQERGHYAIYGEEYGKDYKFKGSWNSKAVDFDGTQLNYLFEASFKHPYPTKLDGFTSITMSGFQNEPPVRYTGMFVDFIPNSTSEGQKTRVGYIRGKKLSNEDARFYKENPEDIHQLIEKYL